MTTQYTDYLVSYIDHNDRENTLEFRDDEDTALLAYKELVEQGFKPFLTGQDIIRVQGIEDEEPEEVVNEYLIKSAE